MWQKRWVYFWKRVGQSRGAFYLGLALFVLIFLGLTGSALNNFAQAGELEQRIAELEEEQRALRAENARLTADGLFFATEEYRELALKRQGKALEGETMLLLPERVESVSATAPADELRDDATIGENWQAWLDFFFRRDRL